MGKAWFGHIADKLRRLLELYNNNPEGIRMYTKCFCSDIQSKDMYRNYLKCKSHRDVQIDNFEKAVFVSPSVSIPDKD